MFKSFREFVFISIFLLVPSFVFSDQVDTKISADTLTVMPNGFLIAKGNVIVQNRNTVIKAEALNFDRNINSIKFTNIYEFHDGKEIRFSADKAEINEKLSEGIIFAAQLLLDETIKIRAGNIYLNNGEVSSATNISSVTSCEECEGKQPNWYLSASSAIRDFENSNVVYRNVTLRVKGLPVAYLPYLRLPDPSVDRAQGFLVPEVAVTSNLATGLKLPYFLPLGLSRDILITPYLSSKTNTVEYRYRQKFVSGDLVIDGAISSDEISEDELRYFTKAKGLFKLGYGINLNLDVGKVSDNSYLGDYNYFEDDDLKQGITLGKTSVKKQQFLEGSLTYLKEKEQDSALDEYFALSGSYLRNISQDRLPGKLKILADLNSSLNVDENNSFSRPPSSARLGLVYNQLDFSGPVRFSQEVFGIFNSFVNSADLGNTNEEYSLQYGYSALAFAPLIRQKKEKLSVFGPKILLSLNNQQNDINGNFFIGSDELSWGNIYSGKKIMSLTESEKALSASIGVDYQVYWEKGARLEVSLAASKIGKLTYNPSTIYGLLDKKLNYLGKFFYVSSTKNEFLANALFSSKGNLIHGDLRGKYTYSKLSLEGNYEFLDKQTDARLSESIKNLNLTTSYNFMDAFGFNIASRYDVVRNQMAQSSFGVGLSFGSWDYRVIQEYLKEDSEKLSISAIYDDECTRLIVSFENRYQDLGASVPVKSLIFRVQLKPFANVVFSQGGDQITF